MMIILTGVAFLLRTATLTGQSLWRDEVDAIRFSNWSLQNFLGGLFQTGHNGPLYFLLLKPWRVLMGSSEFALRFPSAVFGTLVIPLSYILLRQLGFGRRSGMIMGLLCATSPYLIWYGQEAKMYTMLLAVITLAMIAYLKALAGQGTKWWVVFVISTSISFYLHILAPLMLGVYGIIAILWPKNMRRHWRGWLMSMACLTLPYLPLVLWQFPVLVEGGNLGHPFYPLRQELFILLQLYSSGLFRSLGIMPIVLFVFLFLCGLLIKSRMETVRVSPVPHQLLLAVWALLPPLAIYVISLRVPIFEDRYLIYITPAFYGMVVVGLVAVRQYSRSVAALCLGVILMTNLIGIWQQQHQPVKADFRAAAAYLTAEAARPATIIVQIPYLQHTLKYYYRKKYQLIEGLWTNDGKSELVVDTEMRRLTKDVTDLWFVVSEEESWDRRRLVRAWLDAHAHLVDEANFTRVDVYHYQLGANTGETESTETTKP
ncbi:MAG: glycosyltransferase family 39 protein [Anaerolineae bacterium]|nr:glycosyltransferase family 39 protein [Anaerolineae bacterium]